MCTLDKQYTTPSHAPQQRTEVKLDKIHIDLAGGGVTLRSTIHSTTGTVEFIYDNADTPTTKNSRYFMLITDNYSRHRWFFAIAKKSDALQLLIDWTTKMRTQHDLTPKRIRTDGGKE